MRELREAGELVVVGITQEQHPDRCRLYAQWQEFDWPILWDPFNLTGSKAVPVVLAIDEAGCVRAIGPETAWIYDEFLGLEPLQAVARSEAGSEPANTLVEVARHAPGSWERDHYEALSALVWGTSESLDGPLDVLARHAAERPADAALAFRAGVAHRLRYDSPAARPQDFQAAVDHWRRALELRPDQYIWMRRIQQYGPRMDKPYPFYDWVERARSDVRARGETPIELVAELTPAELSEKSAFREASTATEPDPKGALERAGERFAVESTVAFAARGAEPVASVHLALRPVPGAGYHWNNEAEPLRVWLAADGVRLAERSLVHAVEPGTTLEVNSDETRRLSFDAALEPGASVGRVQGYAVFHACDEATGVCLVLRKDFEVRLER